MDYSGSEDDSSSVSQSETQNQNFLKIRSIWKNIEQVKNIQNNSQQKTNKQQLFKHRHRITKQSPFSLNKNKNALYIQSSLKDESYQLKLKRCEKQLQKSKQNTATLIKKLTQAEQQIQYLQYQLQKEANEKILAFELVQKYQNQSKLKQKSYLKQNARQNQENQTQNVKKVRNKEKIIDRLQLKIKSLQMEMKNKDKEIEQLKDQTQELKLMNANQAQNQLSQMNFQGTQLLQLNQAYKTIQRLVRLLKSTQQYKTLANFAQEVKSIHFLQTIHKRLKNNSLSQKIAQKTSCNCMQIKINERLVWTPMMCYKKMLQMKMKYENLNESCIEEVLFQMNKIFLGKQQTRVTKVKQYYEAQMIKLKKKYTQTYDQMLAKKQIQRLKKQLSGKNKNGTNESLIKKNNQNKLKSLGQYEDQIRLKDKQIKLLQERLKLMETQTNSYQKSLYLEGVLWIIDKTLEQLQNNTQDLGKFQMAFRHKIQQINSPQEWLMSYKQFFENVNELNSSLIEKILSLKESTLGKMTK